MFLSYRTVKMEGRIGGGWGYRSRQGRVEEQKGHPRPSEKKNDPCTKKETLFEKLNFIQKLMVFNCTCCCTCEASLWTLTEHRFAR